MSTGGRPRKMGNAEKRLLCQLVEDKPLATLDEITEAFCTHTGVSVHHMTVRRRLDEMGIRRKQVATPPHPLRLSMKGAMAITQPTVANSQNSAIPAHLLMRSGTL